MHNYLIYTNLALPLLFKGRVWEGLRMKKGRVWEVLRLDK
jgi:hypothetical protein